MPGCRQCVAQQLSSQPCVSDKGVKGRDGPMALAAMLADEPKELRQLQEYERGGLSRRRKAIRRLDYERNEAERRRNPS
jgi:hypothetical protein